MVTPKGIVLLMVAFSVVIRASKNQFFVSKGPLNEHVYNYQAEVRSGVLSPNFVSDFTLDVNLHITSDIDSHRVLISFEIPRIQLSNGESSIDRKYRGSFIPLPKESMSLVSPFVIEYDNDGNYVKEIFTRKDEPLWSLNIKKSIASVFQFGWTKFHASRKSLPFVYKDEERTLYGDCNMTLIGTPTPTGYVMEKSYIPFSCTHFGGSLLSTVDFETSDQENDEYFHLQNSRSYTFRKTDDEQYFVEQIVALQSFLYYPFKQMSQTFCSSINQTFIYETSITSSEVEHSIIDLTVPHSLVFENNKNDESGRYPDLSLGRSVFDSQKHFSKLYKMLNEAVVALDDKLIEEELNRRAVMEIMAILRDFDLKHFEDFHKHLLAEDISKDQQRFQLFYSIVPNVGSGAAALFVKDLIKSKKVGDINASIMLATLGASMRVTSPEILTSLDELVHLELEADVKRAALLAFSSIIFKTFSNRPSSDVLHKYVTQFYESLKAAKTYEDQMLHIQMLGNIKIGRVYEYLIPIVEGEKILDLPYNHNLQVHAIWALKKALSDRPDDLLYRTLFSVVINDVLNIEIRVAALEIILDRSNMTQALNIFWIMQKESNHDLISFYFSYYQSNSQNNLVFRNIAGMVNKFAKHREFKGNAHAFVLENINMEIGTGSLLKGHIIKNRFGLYSHVYAELYSIAFNMEIKLMTIFYKYSNAREHKELLNLVMEEYLDNTLQSTDYSELTISAGNNIIYSKYFPHYFWESLFEKAIRLPKYHATIIWFTIQADYNFISDLGTMTQVFVESPQVKHFNADYSLHLNTRSASVGIDYKFCKKDSYGLKNYNPFTAAWHGVRREPSVDLTISKNPIKVSTEPVITIESFSKSIWSELNFRTHVDMKVFIDQETEENYLQLSTNRDHNEVIYVTKGAKYVSEYNILNGVIEDLGLEYDVSVFNCEAQPKGSFYQTLSDFLITPPLSDITKFSFAQTILGLLYFSAEGYYCPKMISCGLKGHIRPSSTPINKIKFTFEGKIPRLTLTMMSNDIFVVQYTSKFSEARDVNIELYRVGKDDSSTSLCFDIAITTVGKSNIVHTFSGYYGHFYGHKEECVKEDFKISVKTISDISDAQRYYANDEHLTYSECRTESDYRASPFLVSSRCAMAAQTLHHSKTIVDYENVPLGLENFMKTLWNWLYVTYPAKYKTSFTPLSKLNQIIIDTEFSMQQENRFDTTVYFPHESYTFKNVHTRFFYLTKLIDKHDFMNFDYVHDMCNVIASADNNYPDYEWTPFFTFDAIVQINIFLKKITPDTMALKIEADNSTIIIEPRKITTQNTATKDPRFQITTHEGFLDHISEVPQMIKIFVVREYVFVSMNQQYFITYNGNRASYELDYKLIDKSGKC